MNWDRAADRLITAMRGVEPVDVQERTGIPAATYRRWVRDRAKGKSIGAPRGAPKEALLRAMDEINGRKELLRGGGGGQVNDSSGGETPAGKAQDGYHDLLAQLERALGETARAPEERKAWARANEIAEPILRIAEREVIAATVRAEALRAAARAMERGEAAALVRAQLAGRGQAGALSVEEAMERVLAKALKARGEEGGGTGTHGKSPP